MQDVYDSLRNEQKFIVVIFDQFEELLRRTDLDNAFRQFRRVILQLTDSDIPLILGFSWKTDGSTTPDNPGYTLWHETQENRADFSVNQFSITEADRFIKNALKNTPAPVAREVRQFVKQNFSGLPWLLKKLLVYFIENTRPDVSIQDFKLSNLFDSEIEELTSTEHALLMFIGERSPVDMHTVHEQFDSKIVDALINRRLVVKSGTTLSLYWDIFRDYLISNKTPFVPFTYFPICSTKKLVQSIRVMSLHNEMTYSDLKKGLGVSAGTVDNFIRDFATFGLVDVDRTAQRFSVTFNDPVDATKKIIAFLMQHVLMVEIHQLIQKRGAFTQKELTQASRRHFKFISEKDSVIRSYISRYLQYCLRFGVLASRGRRMILGKQIQNVLTHLSNQDRLDRGEMFRGEALPERVVELLGKLTAEQISVEQIRKGKFRNALLAARHLGLIRLSGGYPVLTETVDPLMIEQSVKQAAERDETVEWCVRAFSEQSLTGWELGAALAAELELGWSRESERRYGSALSRWVQFVDKR